MHEGESVHLSEYLCKISWLSVMLLKYYRALKMKLPLSILSKLKNGALIRYLTALGHTTSNVYVKNDRRVWQFHKLQHCQEMVWWIPARLCGNCKRIALRTTKNYQQWFDQYSESPNRGKWTHDCCWDRAILPRCGLRSSVTSNNHRNHPSLL